MQLVMELEQDLKVANVICRNGRRHISSSMHEVSSDLIVHSNSKKKQVLLVFIIAPNISALYEAYFCVPMAGAVLNTVNVCLNASTIAFLLGHSSTVVVMVDQEYFTLAEEALKILTKKS